MRYIAMFPLHLSASVSLSDFLEIQPCLRKKKDVIIFQTPDVSLRCTVPAPSSPLSFRLHPVELCITAFGQMASHQHFVKVPRCEPCTVVSLPALSLS